MKKDKTPKKENIYIDRKKILPTIILLSISLLFFAVHAYIPEKLKYIRQFDIFFGCAFLVLGLYWSTKILTKEFAKELYRRIGQAFASVSLKFRAIKNKILTALGLENRIVLRGEEERTIILSNEKRPRRRRNEITRKRFSNLENDRDRVRYLYADYTMARIKKGDSINHYHTPNEANNKMPEEKRAPALTALYTYARYKKSPSIPPEAVKEQYEFVKRNRR